MIEVEFYLIMKFIEKQDTIKNEHFHNNKVHTN